MRKTWVGFLGWEDPLEKGTATHSSILAWSTRLCRPWDSPGKNTEVGRHCLLCELVYSPLTDLYGNCPHMGLSRPEYWRE